MTTIVVRNLPGTVEPAPVIALFSSVGEVLLCEVQNQTARVELASVQDADDAILGLNGHKGMVINGSDPIALLGTGNLKPPPEPKSDEPVAAMPVDKVFQRPVGGSMLFTPVGRAP